MVRAGRVRRGTNRNRSRHGRRADARERIETAVGTGDGQTLAWTVRLSPVTATPVSVTATVDGTPVFGGVDARMFYRKNWNMFRLTGRGLADSAESPVVQTLPDSLTILMR